MNTPENVVLLTEEHKAALTRIIGMASCGSNFLGALGAKDPEQHGYLAIDILAHFAHSTYPSGPEAFLADLREIARICELPVKETHSFKAGAERKYDA